MTAAAMAAIVRSDVISGQPGAQRVLKAGETQVVDKNDKRGVQKVVEKECPDEKVRKIALTILADAIKEANAYGQDKWTVRVKDTARLLVGNYYVCTVRPTGVWLALDDRFLKGGNYYPTMGELNSRGWTPSEPDANRTYKDYSKRNAFSINGLYSIGAGHDDNWPHIKRLFFDFIYKAIYHGQPMGPRSPALHSQGMLEYMRDYLGVDLPDPSHRPDKR
jgi:hypothetical protein